jgi:3-isopropylmalate/(R)-2-methylmalate dehydratase small subunit
MKKLEGRAWVFGDNIDTDLIVPSKYLTERDPNVMARRAFEHTRPDFAKQVKSGDIIIAGNNFGCGSSREEAPFVLQTLGIRFIAAKSFARIFYRNAINLGITLIELKVPQGSINDGDQVEVDFEAGTLKNLRSNKVLKFQKLPAFLQEILDAGGALNWLKNRQA